jgi:hypothetical protein
MSCFVKAAPDEHVQRGWIDGDMGFTVVSR